MEKNLLKNYCLENNNKNVNKSKLRLISSLKLWNKILEEIENNSLPKDDVQTYLEFMIENNFSLDHIQTLFEYDHENSKKNENIFKWACAFSSVNVIDYIKNQQSESLIKEQGYNAIQSSIMYFKKDSLLYLIKNNFPVWKEEHFIQAISRSQQSPQLIIMRIFMNNLEKIDNLTSFSAVHLRKTYPTNFTYPEATTEDNDMWGLAKKIDVIILNNNLEKELKNKNNKIENPTRFKV